MKFTHEITSPAQVGVGGHPYRGRTGEELEWHGFQAGLIIVAPDLLCGGPADVIHIEGNVKHVRRALADCLSAMGDLEKSYREDLNKLRAEAGLPPLPAEADEEQGEPGLKVGSAPAPEYPPAA